MGAAKMMDLRGLVPRTPPEGLEQWVLETCREELDRNGLVYEAEYVRDYSLLSMLDERSQPKKVKMVRAICSCCTESILLDWAKDGTHGYGFVHPDDEEGNWIRTVTAAGDESNCPICGARVLVNKRSAVKGYYVTAETSVMSAALVGDGMALLALTGWTVQRRVSKSGASSIKIIPAESYVFGPHDCVQLMGWHNAYSGNTGYFIQYYREWRQPAHWKERWGSVGRIFGLTPELVAASCLPHCKLDVYMGGGPGAGRYPVAYLRLYQIHPNVESVLIHGLPRLLRDLIGRQAADRSWEKNDRGLMELPEIDWEEHRPAQMLRLTREELRMARAQDWGVWPWDLFVRAKEHGEVLTAEDIETAFCLGDDHAAELAGRGPVAKSLRYLLDQCEATAVEAEDEDPPPHGIPDVQTLLDYWSMARTLGRNLNDQLVRFPRDLLDAHDQASEQMKERETDLLVQQFRFRRRLLRKYAFAADGLLIRPAASQKELTAEGNALHHCVGTYGKRHATGATAIFFIRRASRPWESYYTLELDEKELKVQQNRGKHNCARTPEIQAFEDKWLAWVRVGAPRGQDGKPVGIQGRQTRKGRAA